MNPEERLPGPARVIDDIRRLPDGVALPAGVKKEDYQKWYAQTYTTLDGRTWYEFYKRGNKPALPDGSFPPDPIHATVEGPLDREQAEKFEKDKKAAAEAPPTRVVGGVLQERGPDGVYRPVQTETGPATATTAPAQAAAPGGKAFIDDGPEAGAHGRRWGWNPETHLYDRDLGPSPSAQKTPDPADKVGKPTGNTRQTTKNGTTVKETEYQLPDGSTAWRSQTETDAPDLVGKPTGNTRQRIENGQAIKEAEYVLPSGSTVWRSQTAPADTKDNFVPEPADAPAFATTPGQVVQGLRAYSSYLAQQVKMHLDSGGKQGISPENATKLMNQRVDLAERMGKEQGALASTQASVYGTDVTQRGQTLGETENRRSAANTAYNNTLARFVPNITMMGPGGGKLVADALASSLGANQAYVDQWGGFRESPEITRPAFLQQVRDASMAGIQTAAQGGPQIFASRPVSGAPEAASPAPSMSLRPSAEAAEIEAANQSAQAGFRNAVNPLTAPPAAPAANPVSGNPIMLPSAPPATTTVPAPGPMSPPRRDDWNQPGPPINLDPSQGPVGMRPTFLDQNRYDPISRGLALGIPTDILELALAG